MNIHSKQKRSAAIAGLSLVVCLALLLAAPARAQQSAGVDVSPQLFTVMCALYAAGFEGEPGGAGATLPFQQVRTELAKLDGPATQALREYFREHRSADPGETMARYISFALVVGPPPRFEHILRREELPADVLALDGFNEILAAFFREAQIERFWPSIQPVYAREIQRLREPVGQIVFVSTGYLREIQRPTSGRQFTVYVEPLVGAKTNFRSYSDRYGIVVNPGKELPVEDIRHAYLHFLLDPLAYRHPRAVERARPLHQFLSRAARLSPELRDPDHFPEFLTECLVRAVELRLKRLPADRLVAAIDEAELDGYVLVRSLYFALDEFDKSEPAMSFFFPDLIQQIDVAAEAKRLERVQFAAARPAQAPERPQASELETWLRDAERKIALSDGAGAAASFERVLAKYPGQARALYGLGVARLLQGQTDPAKAAFRELVSGAPAGTGADARILSMSHVYLGRIHDLEGNRELALSEYRAALAVQGAPEMAVQLAQRGLEKKFEPVRREAEPQRPQ